MPILPALAGAGLGFGLGLAVGDASDPGPLLPGPLDPTRGYELYATLNGQGVPVNLALEAKMWGLGQVQFHLLGPFAGDSALGFGLSGAGAAVMAAGAASGLPPSAFGLPAYVGAYVWDPSDPSAGNRMELVDASFLSQTLGPQWVLAAGGL